MAQITISVPEAIQSHIDQFIASGEFANAADYFLALATRDLKESGIERLLEEAEDDFANGDVTEFEKGSFIAMGDELIRQRRAEKGQ